jgi:Spy/CpxP family protein refolding chaperone
VKKRIFAISFAALLIAGLMIVGVATAQPRDDRPGYGSGGYWGCPYYPGGPEGDTLSLTADQQKKLVNIQEKYATENDKITDDIVKVERDLRKLYTSEKPDLKAIDKAEDQIKGLMDKRFALGREFRNSARALLTDEQLKANPYAFTGPGSCLNGGFGRGHGRGMMGGYGPGGGRW